MGDDANVVCAGEQGVDGGAVQVLHTTEVDGERSSAADGLGDRSGERLIEGVDIAEVDLPRRDQQRLPAPQRAVSRVSTWASCDLRG